MRALAGEHPYRENLWAALILALHRSGRPAEALAAYGQARAVLREGTGMDPSRRLRLLQERILADDPALEAESLL